MRLLGLLRVVWVGFVAISVAAAAVACGACGPVPSEGRCAPSTSPSGPPGAFSTAGREVTGARISALVSCKGDPTGGAYVIVDVGQGARRLQLLRGAIRCADGVFRDVDGHRPTCDFAQPAAPTNAPVFVDSFFRDVATEWAKERIESVGIGLLACKGNEPMIALSDYTKADRAAEILVERARVWQVGGPLNLVVSGIRGACLD